MQQSFGKTGRLDAEYYQEKYEPLIKHISAKPHKKLSEIVSIKKSIEPSSKAYTEENEQGLPFLRVADYHKTGINSPQKKIISNIYQSKQPINQLKPKAGTILFSKDGSVGTAYCLHENADFITSRAILHLMVKNTNIILPDCLIINSKLFHCKNASRPRCREFNYLTLASR